LTVPLQIASTHQSKYFRCYHCTENGAYKSMRTLENYESNMHIIMNDEQ
jgi:hypothetical protein